MRKFAICLGVMVAIVLAVLVFAPKASAYTGPAGCPSYIPPHSTGLCAYHTDIRHFGVYASVKHHVWMGGVAGDCSPGPCTAWTPWLSSGWNGRPTVLNYSDYGLYLYWGKDES